MPSAEFVLLAAIATVQMILTIATLVQVRSTLADERARSDNYAAALLITRQETKAASSIRRETTGAKKHEDALTRPRQIGMSPR